MSKDSTGDSPGDSHRPPPRPKSEEMSSNPYASGHLHAANPPAKQFSSHYVRLRPHRGSTVLALGLAGAITAIFGGMIALIFYICCPLVLIPLASLGLSIPAWIMGQKDLNAMKEGVMDPSGRDITMLGMIAGIVGTAIVAVGALVVTALIVIYVIFIGLAISSEAGA